MTIQDVFVSYAHVDNEALLEEQEGWISIFQRALEKRLAQLLGRPAAVWWDRRRLTGNHYFDDTIAEACVAATTMVSVVTPRYLKSDYCQKEVAHFASCKPLRVQDRSRLFTCTKTPVERERLFQAMEGKLGYDFFRADPESGRFREYSVYDPELKSQFMMRLEDLAQDLSSLIAQTERVAPVGTVNLIAARPTATAVLVATTSSDVKQYRENIVRELLARNFVCQPERDWSEDAAGFERELATAQAAVGLSIHILGSKSGTTPEDGEATYPVLQFDRLKQSSQARPADQPLARIIWIPPSVVGSGEKQLQFLQRVRDDATLGPLDELLEGSEEELKERVVAKLEALEVLRREAALRALQAPKIDEAPSSASPESMARQVRKIYVISAEGEAMEVEDVERVLGEQGFDVFSSVELAETEIEAEREAQHQRWLQECDGCLIYHGSTKVSWVRAQIDEVRKVLGTRSRGPMRSHAIYVAPPFDALKQRYQVHFPKLEGNAAPAQVLKSFVQKVVGEISERRSTAGSGS